MSDDIQRSCFESWFKRYLNQPHKLLRDPKIDLDGYAYGDVTTAWHSWCAAISGWNAMREDLISIRQLLERLQHYVEHQDETCCYTDWQKHPECDYYTKLQMDVDSLLNAARMEDNPPVRCEDIR